MNKEIDITSVRRKKREVKPSNDGKNYEESTGEKGISLITPTPAPQKIKQNHRSRLVEAETSDKAFDERASRLKFKPFSL